MRPNDLMKLREAEEGAEKVHLTEEQKAKVIKYRSLLLENRKKASRAKDDLMFLMAEESKLNRELFDALEQELGFEVMSCNWEEGYVTKDADDSNTERVH